MPVGATAVICKPQREGASAVGPVLAGSAGTGTRPPAAPLSHLGREGLNGQGAVRLRCAASPNSVPRPEGLGRAGAAPRLQQLVVAELGQVRAQAQLVADQEALAAEPEQVRELDACGPLCGLSGGPPPQLKHNPHAAWQRSWVESGSVLVSHRTGMHARWQRAVQTGKQLQRTQLWQTNDAYFLPHHGMRKTLQ